MLTIAQVRKAHGLRGELKLQVLVDHVETLLQVETLYVGETASPYSLERFRWHGRELLIKLAGCDDCGQAGALRDQLVRVKLEDVPPLEPGQYYHHQLLGLRVVTLEAEELGTLDEILETGANDVYVVHGPRGEVLLPAQPEVIRQVDLEQGLMRVYLLPGLV